jgi:spermidine synthase
MSSASHGSEEAMAQVALQALPRAVKAPRLLIGGLGMGYTLRAALELLPPEGSVTVAELSPAVLAWNRGPLAPLARSPLGDPRVSVVLGDVLNRLHPQAFDAILLDVDNGPEGLSQPANRRLYGPEGVARFHRALAPQGVWVVWSAGPDPLFLKTMGEAGFDASAQGVPARSRGGGGRGSRHHLFVGVRRGG